jgi:minor extracellular protease Epr
LHIINISISGGKKAPLALVKAIQTAVQRGIIVVAAAGNSGNVLGIGDTVEIPARLPWVLSVASLNIYNQRDSYSATGKVDIAAPGSRILSTYLDKRYAILSGTSMATAHVTGALAIYRRAYPSLPSRQLKQILLSRAIDLPPKGKDPFTGVGLVQVKIP